uniref:Notch n=1 Tax=Macrostomum lignano TaxID=282301 RepID=A0A1I8HH94_9PLAT
ATQLNHSKCNICSTEPCLNGGTCRTVSYDRFACDCQAGFEGKRCQNRLDACFGSPCHNQAECEVLRFGRYRLLESTTDWPLAEKKSTKKHPPLLINYNNRCRCKIGFSGTHCETNIDDCIGHRCQNNATCLDGVNNYTCNCSPGFTGRYCETRLHYCTDYNPCQNGGECVTDPATGYSPKQNEFWAFKRPCMNGGSCIDGIGSYTCQCRPGYTGRLCERLEMASLIMDVPDAAVNRGVCTHHECLNGGRCIQEGSEYRCQCLA